MGGSGVGEGGFIFESGREPINSIALLVINWWLECRESSRDGQKRAGCGVGPTRVGNGRAS